MGKILFFTPLAGRTGSEVTLYNLITHADRTKYPMVLISGLNGELLEEMPKDVSSFSYEAYWLALEKARSNMFVNVLDKIYRKIGKAEDLREEFIIGIHKKYKPDVWYINTILQSHILQLAIKYKVPCILHTHELEPLLSALNEKQIEDLITYPKLIIACSQAAANVMRVLGRKKGLEVCYPSIKLEDIKSDPLAVIDTRQKLGIGKKTFVWAMSGYIDTNKNPVLFVEVANNMIRKGQDVHFIWIGGKPTEGLAVFARKKAESLGIADKITWTGSLSRNYYDFLSAADGFLLTSTRESFSIVSLESLALGKPVVTFDCGGIKEFVSSELGIVINTWNKLDLENAMLHVMQGQINFDPIKAKLSATQFDIYSQIKHWENIIEKYFDENNQ